MLEQTLRAYLSSKPEAIEDYPFGPDAAVYKVQGKMFALVFVQQGECRVNLKCDPQEAMELRHVFDAVLPGYHMNKRHWNTVRLDGSLPGQHGVWPSSHVFVLRLLYADGVRTLCTASRSPLV